MENLYCPCNGRFPAPGAKFMFHHQNQNQNLIGHSGFIIDTHAESVQVHNEPITFGYWFWHGGFMVAISYLIIILGTGVFIKHLFSLMKRM